MARVAVVAVLALAGRCSRTVYAVSVSSAVHLHGELAAVKNRFAHGSAVALIAVTRAVDTGPVFSAAVRVLARTCNAEAEHQRLPGVMANIDCAQHRQRPIARHELSGIYARGAQHAKLWGIPIWAIVDMDVRGR